jgi:hypothetical protein
MKELEREVKSPVLTVHSGGSTHQLWALNVGEWVKLPCLKGPLEAKETASLVYTTQSPSAGYRWEEVGIRDFETWQWIEAAFIKSAALEKSLAELLEICRSKCGPHDEVILPDGKPNHQALIEATELFESWGQQ